MRGRRRQRQSQRFRALSLPPSSPPFSLPSLPPPPLLSLLVPQSTTARPPTARPFHPIFIPSIHALCPLSALPLIPHPRAMRATLISCTQTMSTKAIIPLFPSTTRIRTTCPTGTLTTTTTLRTRPHSNILHLRTTAHRPKRRRSASLYKPCPQSRCRTTSSLLVTPRAVSLRSHMPPLIPLWLSWCVMPN